MLCRFSESYQYIYFKSYSVHIFSALVELPPVLLAYEDIEKNMDTRESMGRSEILPLLRYKGRLGMLTKSSCWKRKGVCDASYMGTGLHE